MFKTLLSAFKTFFFRLGVGKKSNKLNGHNLAPYISNRRKRSKGVNISSCVFSFHMGNNCTCPFLQRLDFLLLSTEHRKLRLAAGSSYTRSCTFERGSFTHKHTDAMFPLLLCSGKNLRAVKCKEPVHRDLCRSS